MRQNAEQKPNCALCEHSMLNYSGVHLIHAVGCSGEIRVVRVYRRLYPVFPKNLNLEKL